MHENFLNEEFCVSVLSIPRNYSVSNFVGRILFFLLNGTREPLHEGDDDTVDWYICRDPFWCLKMN